MRITRALRRQIVLAIAGVMMSGPALAAGCPAPPPPARDLAFERYYSDKRGSVVDEDRRTAYEAARARLTTFVGTVAKRADRARTKSSAAARAAEARCALDWLRTWAAGEAYLGRMSGKQAEYQRKWDLAGLALAYIKLKPFASPEVRRIVEPWLDALAVRARRFFDDPGRKRNNHWYWLGLGLGATAIATGNEAHWSEARRIMGDAARDISSDGTLAMELARGRRALHYHAFAAMPLVVLAELAAARGEDWYGERDGALHRLTARTASGLAQPATFAGRAGQPQDEPVKPGAGWLQLYSARFPQRLPPAVLAGLPASKPGHRWLGGDVRNLTQALAPVAR